MSNLEEQLLHLLTEAQSSALAPRQQAEAHLQALHSNEAFPTGLAAIAAHTSLPISTRQAALTTLRLFAEKNWSGEDEETEGPTVAISDDVKAVLRSRLLELATSGEDERRVRGAASYVVSKIASVDFPDQWPTLLPTLLQIIPTASDAQLHGALKVLADLVDDSLNEDQFFAVARDVMGTVYNVAVDDNRKMSLRALAVGVFRGCFDIMDMVKDEHGTEVKAFADEVLQSWSPFFLQVMKLQFPARSQAAGEEGLNREPESWRGVVALKLQVVKTLMKIRQVFAQLLLPQSPVLFTATWEELSSLQDTFKDLYIDHDDQGRLEDADGLPYTLDFLVLEELDFLQSCLRAPPVREELETALQNCGGISNTPWVVDVMKLAVAYAQIPSEEEGLWDIDVNLFLAEETSVTANYTARTACGDLLIKLGEWLHQGAFEGLLTYTRVLFASPDATWRTREASLYLLTQLLNDFLDIDKHIHAETAASYLEFIEYAVNRQDEPLLRARGYIVAGVLIQSISGSAFPTVALLDRTIKAIHEDESEVVKVACIKAIQGFIKAPEGIPSDRQIPIAVAISEFLNAKDLTELEDSDDLLVTLVESLRAATQLDYSIAIAAGSGVIDLLLLMAKHGAASFQLTVLVNETFEDIVQSLSSRGAEGYIALCEKVMPSLTGALDVGSVTEDNPLTTLACELIAVLTENGSEPLPPGFVVAVMPKLSRLLLSTIEGEILRPGSEALKFIIMHDPQQLFEWHDEAGRSGLEVCLIIIDRLLGPTMEDNAASEVGGVAAELVEKAGQERLGPFLPQLLQAVASRLATAEAAPFIQSLILVFARLSLVGAADVVEFLNQIEIGGQSGLQVVLSKWLEHSVSFAGYDEIRQNVIALSKLYSLNDTRVAQTMVKGDLIVPTSDRIMTRSRAKNNPDQYTIVPAPLKIVKVLIEELLSASGVQNAATALAVADFADEEDDDGWEDLPSILDLGSGAAKADLMAYAEGLGGSFMRQRDDETQAYLTDFFVRASTDNIAGFNELYAQLTDEEKAKLEELAKGAQAAQ
ncbi:hypothetical protein VC83_09490 [Pseudogymnoascus destructans]|uniref:Importin N-terminal domain-containing protein n=2 Tax=Pseudogymnoascus destructans TaxID=655981 RepID=L8FR18_PSED2|nr:uncharacterized protein VC83_09490 [Pseudogymnoascus destructans]ELR02111.1 hypothetical protein GMDG_05271 [Pseudogymnoascus destructans 20631-21]OAF54233.2 hypothetical protein VC83_09490 [Pseudogymnoascus destructans]